MPAQFSETELSKLKNILLVYEWSQQLFIAKLNIIHQDLIHFKNSNPIEHIKGRIKSAESIAGKLERLKLEITADNAKEHIKDIAGIRIICPFAKDIHGLVDIIKSMPDWKIYDQKDYITNPKPSGYRSYHLIIGIPVFYSGKEEDIPVEVQIRTASMDFWASMEHKVRYKYDEQVPKHLSDELVICAEKISELDKRMSLIQEIVSLINQ